MHYPTLDLKNFNLTWRAVFYTAAFVCAFYINPILAVPLFIVFLMSKQVIVWFRNVSRYGNPRISVASVLGQLIGGFALTICLFTYLDAINREEREAPVRRAQEAKYAATLCPEYFASNFIQRWNDGPAWCRDYPQFDRTKAAKVTTTDSDTTLSSTSLWK